MTVQSIKMGLSEESTGLWVKMISLVLELLNKGSGRQNVGS